MKKFFLSAFLIASSIGIASAQKASEYDVTYSPTRVTRSTSEYANYNRIGISYNNTQYSFSGRGWDEDLDNSSLNGFGIDYIHGFSLSGSLPMFLEVGANINYNAGNAFEFSGNWGSEKMKIQNFNIQIPVNYVYRFNVADEFSIAPYLGLNFKLHLLQRGKYEEYDAYEDEKWEGEWESFFDKDNWDPTWKRFQMGWHVGVNFQYSKISLGVQYGTDFIPAYSDEGDKVNTGNLKLTLGYNF